MSALSQFFSGGGDKLVPVEIFAVGGGGGGADGLINPAGPNSSGGGGGGAGLAVYCTNFAVVGKSYIITIGAGGAVGANGTSTEIPGVLGNVLGGNGSGATVLFTGSAAGINNDALGPFPAQSSYTSTQININSFYTFANNSRVGGGGARSSVSQIPLHMDGGDGIPLSLIGYPSIICGGGGGGGGAYSEGPVLYPEGTGGTGGGGNGGAQAAKLPSNTIGQPGASGTTNTGGGGGGGGSGRPSFNPGVPQRPAGTGGSGGSGVLFIRYPTAFDAATVTGNTPTPAQPGYHVYRWNSGPATITFN